MKILSLFNRIPYPPNDGGSIALYYLLKHLNIQGHEVHLAAVNTTKHHADPRSMESIASIHTVDVDTTVTPIGALRSYFSPTPYIAQRFYSKELDQMLGSLVKDAGFDIIQIDLAYSMVYAQTIRDKCRSPLVFRPHNVEAELWSRTAEAERHPLKRTYLRRMARQIRGFELRTAALADKIIAITDRDADYFRAHFPDKPVVSIPAGVETGNYDSLPDISPEAASICFLGSLEWMPNIQGIGWFLDQVWPRIRETVPEASFHIAGKNPPSDLMKLALPGVVVHGQVDSAPMFIRSHEIMVVPLLSGGGMRLKMVEGMAAGRPVVSTSVGAEGIEGSPGDHFIVADSAQQFAESCIGLLQQPALRKKLSMQAASIIQARYDWEAITLRFVQEYQSMGTRRKS